MKKWLLLGLAILVGIGLVWFVLRILPGWSVDRGDMGKIVQQVFDHSPLPQPSVESASTTDLPDILRNRLRDKFDNVINDVKNSVDRDLGSGNGNNSSGQNSNGQVVVSLGGPSGSANNSSSCSKQIDFKHRQNLAINLTTNSSCQINFYNFPNRFCLYISNNQYRIPDNQSLILKSRSPGTYQMTVDFCDPSDRQVGKMVVQ